MEWLRATGHSYKEMEKQGRGLVVVEALLNYRRPAYFDDELTLRTDLADLGKVSLRFDYEVLARRGCARHGPHAPRLRRPDNGQTRQDARRATAARGGQTLLDSGPVNPLVAQHAARLLDAGVAGTRTSHGAENNLYKIGLLLEHDEANTFGMENLLTAVGFEEAYEAVARPDRQPAGQGGEPGAWLHRPGAHGRRARGGRKAHQGRRACRAGGSSSPRGIRGP